MNRTASAVRGQLYRTDRQLGLGFDLRNRALSSSANTITKVCVVEPRTSLFLRGDSSSSVLGDLPLMAVCCSPISPGEQV